MLTDEDRAKAQDSGKTWGELLNGEPAAKKKTITVKPANDSGMGIFGGGGSIPMWPSKDKTGPSKTSVRVKKTGSRFWSATKAGTYDRLRRKKRTFLRVLFFGDSRPAGAGWTFEKRSRAAKKAVKKRRRDSRGRLK